MADPGPLRVSSYARSATDDRFRRIAQVWNTYAPPACGETVYAPPVGAGCRILVGAAGVRDI
jgi:hypothetical protein